jgi:hypothetical protein
VSNGITPAVTATVNADGTTSIGGENLFRSDLIVKWNHIVVLHAVFWLFFRNMPFVIIRRRKLDP